MKPKQKKQLLYIVVIISALIGSYYLLQFLKIAIDSISVFLMAVLFLGTAYYIYEEKLWKTNTTF